MKRYTLEQFYKEKLNKIYCCDSLTALKAMPDECIDMIITSPPYWSLRDYGKSTKIIWDGDKNCKHNFSIIHRRRSDKSGIHGNPKFMGKGTVEAQDKARFGKPTNTCSLCDAWYGSLGLEPTFDLYIKHLCDIFDEGKRVLKKTGTIWINIGDTYGQSGKGAWKNKHSQKEVYVPDKKPRIKETLPAKCLLQIPFRFSIEMVNRGWTLRNTVIWQKPNAMPSSCRDRFTVDFEYLFFFSKNKKYYFERQFEPYAPASDVRYRQRLRAGKTYNSKEPYKKNLPYHSIKRRSDDKDGLCVGGYEERGRNKRCVWSIPTRPFKGAHFAVFPSDLLETPIKAGCPEFICKKCGKPRIKIYKSKNIIRKRLNPTTQPTTERSPSPNNYGGKIIENISYTNCSCKNPSGDLVFDEKYRPGIVLDPFIGAGTTALVAKKLGRNFIGLELNPDYIKIANKRLKENEKQTIK